MFINSMIPLFLFLMILITGLIMLGFITGYVKGLNIKVLVLFWCFNVRLPLHSVLTICFTLDFLFP